MSLLPYNMQDKNNLAIEKCIKEIFDIDTKSIMISIADLVDGDILEYLSEENHIQGKEGWDLAQNRNEKIELLKTAMKLHATKGIKSAIERLLNVLNLSGEVSEWFDYNGKPNKFKVVVITSESITEDVMSILFDSINCYKNQRSILDILTLRTALLVPKVPIYTGVVLSEGIKSIYDCRN